MNIESVVEDSSDKSSDDLHDAMCIACEMMVVWMQNQLRRNDTEDQILDYVNAVSLLHFLLVLWRNWLVTTHANNCDCSSVTDCPVQMENQWLNVAVCPPCPVSRLKLVVNYLNCHLSRYGNSFQYLYYAPAIVFIFFIYISVH